MKPQTAQLSRSLPVVIALATVLAAGCFRHSRPDIAPPAPVFPVMQVVSPTTSAPQGAAGAPVASVSDESAEPYIESLVVVNSDVRLVLQKIAEIGKLDLVIPGNIHKTISVRYVHVPVSVALKDVLARSGLQISAGRSAPPPFDTVTVFYRLPANVDSLSVDGIMKRFGVGREIAELIVQARPPER